VRSSASYFNFQYPLLSLRSSSSSLRLLPRLPVTSVLHSIFPSITWFRRQFQRKMWSIQLVFPHFICIVAPSSLTVFNAPLLSRSVQMIFSILLQDYFSKLSRYFLSTFQSVQFPVPLKAVLQMYHLSSFLLKFKSNLLVKKCLLLDEWLSWIWFHVYVLRHLLWCYQTAWNSSHFPVGFDLS